MTEQDWENTTPLTQVELRALLPISEDEEEPADLVSDSESEDSVENDFSPSESEYEAESTYEENSDLESNSRKRKKTKAIMSTIKRSRLSSEEFEDQEPLSGTVAQENNSVPEEANLKKVLKGKDGHRWCTVSNIRKRTAKRNLLHIVQGPIGAARNANTPLAAFRCLFNQAMFAKILEHTNSRIKISSEKYKVAKSTVSTTTTAELNALIGLLIFAGAQKDNHLSTSEMFDSKKSGFYYRATMSCDRFEFLVNMIRFDDKTTRSERKSVDKFAPIREIWDEFIQNCNVSYKPGSYISVDEQLLGFRGRCPFKMYISSKPAKYDIKIVMSCDVGSKYMLDAEPYLAKHTKTNGVPLGEYYVKNLTKCVHGSNRNITMDNWFTSVSLADQLLNAPYNLTIIGTLRQNKREIPPEMIALKNRDVGSSLFCHDQEKTLVSYKTKKNKCVLVLSTMHEGSVIYPDTKKPEMILHYNETKGGVDAFDQMCGNRSCSRKTRRWPQCIFYGMLNMACINALIIYNHNLQRMGQRTITRKEFMNQLHEELVKPWLEQRYRIPTLQRSLKLMISDILGMEQEIDKQAPLEEKRTTCYMCPSKKRRMTSLYCKHCRRAFCAEHRARCCVSCDSEK